MNEEFPHKTEREREGQRERDRNRERETERDRPTDRESTDPFFLEALDKHQFLEGSQPLVPVSPRYTLRVLVFVSGLRRQWTVTVPVGCVRMHL